MNSPVFGFDGFSFDTSLVFALLVGLGFGFFLERSGLGSAKKLVGQFYLRDMTVFKVMFTAILTSMVGLYWLDFLGFLDLSGIYLVPTYIVPQVLGGLVFGTGFIVGGYCPGTGCVATSTGSLDGLVHVGGMLIGILIFGELFPSVEWLYTATPMGQINFAEYLGLPFGVLVFGVILLALGGFMLSEKAESVFGQEQKQPKV